jgi:hypothetical protein
MWGAWEQLPKAFREALRERGYRTGRSLVHTESSSKDGTRKFLLRLQDGRVVETVGIPVDDENQRRLTVCVSSQVLTPSSFPQSWVLGGGHGLGGVTSSSFPQSWVLGWCHGLGGWVFLPVWVEVWTERTGCCGRASRRGFLSMVVAVQEVQSRTVRPAWQDFSSKGGTKGRGEL